MITDFRLKSKAVEAERAKEGQGQNWTPESSFLRPYTLDRAGTQFRAQHVSGKLPRSGRGGGRVSVSPGSQGSPSSGRIALALCSAALCLSACHSLSRVCTDMPAACSPDTGRVLPVSHCLLCFLPAQAVTDP